MTASLRSQRLSWVSLLALAGLMLWLLLSLLPLVWAAVLSIRTYADAFSTPIVWSAPFTFEHYLGLLRSQGFRANAANSLIVTSSTVIISLSVGTMAGYALARYSGVWGLALLMAALLFRAIPHSTLLPAFYEGFTLIGINNNLFTLIMVLVAINQPFTMWMMRAFFIGVPRELDEAAIVDGCSPFQAFLKVVVPVMWPGVLTAGLFSFTLAYNDFLLSSALTNADQMTLPVFLGSVIAAESDALLMQGVAGSVLISLPLVFLVLIFQKHLVAGMTAGAVKG